MAAWSLRVHTGSQPFPSALPPPAAGVRLCKFLLSAESQVPEDGGDLTTVAGAVADGAVADAIDAAAAAGPSTGYRRLSDARTVATFSDAGGSPEEATDPAEEEMLGDYNPRLKTWVRCRLCKDAHRIMYCCVPDPVKGGPCMTYCKARPLSSTEMVVACSKHPKHTHVVPAPPGST